MRLSTREDVEAPIGFVFGRLCDFDSWERAALRRGADVQRTDGLTAAQPGMGWQVQIDYRGKLRSGEVRLAVLEAPQKLLFTGAGGSFEATLEIELLELGPRRTRVVVISEARPRSLSARVLLHSVKLGKAKLVQRYEHQVARLAADIEERFRRA
ncbi:SRPBCC family protein [Cereibacter changlensis JA139]|uniref:SRPBCC family protein n=2 Tax=Cereibacter changlensis TaxID=402884 RepID=A0A2T4JXH7_9RHOB|nr:SRPBCC family protein [Cereibacter changlensis]PTE22595.1 SRPBCC family protein [Cereibacter changlensis JA139]PZX50819.1 hypothetical protein LX76_03359 [Cereibacter changlensis]